MPINLSGLPEFDLSDDHVLADTFDIGDETSFGRRNPRVGPLNNNTLQRIMDATFALLEEFFQRHGVEPDIHGTSSAVFVSRYAISNRQKNDRPQADLIRWPVEVNTDLKSNLTVTSQLPNTWKHGKDTDIKMPLPVPLEPELTGSMSCVHLAAGMGETDHVLKPERIRLSNFMVQPRTPWHSVCTGYGSQWQLPQMQNIGQVTPTIVPGNTRPANFPSYDFGTSSGDPRTDINEMLSYVLETAIAYVVDFMRTHDLIWGNNPVELLMTNLNCEVVRNRQARARQAPKSALSETKKAFFTRTPGWPWN